MAVITRLLLLLWAGVAVSSVVELQKRIVGGRDCGPNERLYHVEVRAYVTFPGADFTICGGSLISDEWILTAGHCWNASRTMRAVVGIHPGGQGTPEEITRHFFRDNRSRIHDIILLQLNNPTQIHPVPLPDCGNPPNVGETVQVAGRASTTMGPNNERQPGRANVLQCADTTLIDCQELRNCWQRNYPLTVNAYQYQDILCYRRGGVDTSAGDSGGGVVFNGMIYGVHAFTGNHTHACVDPAGGMNVCGYMDWIVRTTGIPRPTPGPGPGPAPRSRTRPNLACPKCTIL